MSKVRLGIGALFLATCSVFSLPAQAQADCADLSLVLAIDASGSITPDEFSLQLKGYGEAFRTSAVHDALASAGTVDVAVVIWGDTEMPPQVTPWRRISSPDESQEFGNFVERIPRLVNGNTGIGLAVSTALDMLQDPGRCSLRDVINVSGDGMETIGTRPRHHVPLASARERAARMGVTINGLAITTLEPGLANWYRDQMITGPGSFVMEVANYQTFGGSLVRKLVREITPANLATLLPDVEVSIEMRKLSDDPRGIHCAGRY